MFTSADEDVSAPLFPYQRRLGGFHLLVHMIANILTSYETSPLREFRKKVARQVSTPRSLPLVPQSLLPKLILPRNYNSSASSQLTGPNKASPSAWLVSLKNRSPTSPS